jgi:hypothetical protein
MTPEKLFAPRRVGVCGSSKSLSQPGIEFCTALGIELANMNDIVIVSGGSRKRAGTDENDLATDWYIVSSVERQLRETSGPEAIDSRIETVVIDASSASSIGSKSSQDGLFQIGALRRARGKTREARRISFVKSLDGLLAVAGRGGTAQELALAMELATAVLPVPLFEGAAQQFWDSYEPDLMRMLQIDRGTANRWRSPPSLDEPSLSGLAREMVTTLADALPRRCFVIMPFSEDHQTLYDFVIERAISSLGDHPIHLGRTAMPGDVGRQIQDGIKNCDYAVAVLDGLRRMYSTN